MAEQYSKSETLARAVAQSLTDASDNFAWPFIAEFRPLPDVQLKEIGDSPRVFVRDIGQRSPGRGTRAWTDNEYTIEIIARVKLGNDRSYTLSRLKLLSEQLSDWFWSIFPTEDADETLTSIPLNVIGSDPDLDEQSVGMIQLQLVFFGSRELPSH